LYSFDAAGQFVMSRRARLPHSVEPGGHTELNGVVEIPAAAVIRPWRLDLLVIGSGWLARRGKLVGDARLRSNRDEEHDGASGVSRDSVHLVFLHIPKVAGTSLNFLLKQNYGFDQVLQWGDTIPPSQPCESRLLAPFPVVAGHRVRGDYPSGIRALYTAVVRDPVARAASLFAHYLRPDLSDDDDPSVKRARINLREEYVQFGGNPDSIVETLQRCHRFRNQVTNYQCRYLAESGATLDAAKRAMAAGDYVVGCVESLGQFNEYLADLLGWPLCEPPRKNRSHRGAQEQLLAEVGAREALARLNLEDQALYAFIRDQCRGLYVNLPNSEGFRGSRIHLYGECRFADGVSGGGADYATVSTPRENRS
jgi:hypothetical protein